MAISSENTGLDTFASTGGHRADEVDGGRSSILTLAMVWPEMRVVPMVDAVLSIGRSSTSTAQLLGPRVSREHCSIKRTGPIFVLSDSGSTNGTRLNGHRVEEAPLCVGDVVRIGDWVGVVLRLRQGESAVEEVSPGIFAGVKLRSVIAQAELAAKSELPILLHGETGTGKEVLSRYIHDKSGRSGPLVAVNCAALPEALAEAELFGHRKGAFTGANQSALGYFRSADGGTLLLDEVGDLDRKIQGKLLRVLQELAVVPVGETTAVKVDVRVIAAGQSPLSDLVESGTFRADLYARLAGLELKMPPQRERREEVADLFSCELKSRLGGRSPKLKAELVEHLLTQDWPLNSRQVIQTAARTAVLHGHRSVLDRGHLVSIVAASEDDDAHPPGRTKAVGENASARADRRRQSAKRRAERLAELKAALARHQGNLSRAASELRLSRSTAYRLLELDPSLNLTDMRQPSPDSD